jgi:hypothetical protein
MKLLNELHRIVSLHNSEIKIWALESAYWIFERNLWLSLDEQAEAIAFLVTTALNEREPELRERYFRITGRLVASRPYTVGSHIDWETLIEQLPHLSSSEVLSVLYLLRYANDEKYLAVLERYFDDFGKHIQAINSWIILAYTQRYKYDAQVWPYLHTAQQAINESFSDWGKRMQQKTGRADITAEERRVSAKERRAARSWTMERLSETQEQIRQQVQIQDRTAYIYTKAWNEQNPNYLPNQIQGWLALPEAKDRIGPIGNLDWIFEQTLSIETDEMAQGVKVLVDYALTGEERSVVGEETIMSGDTTQHEKG